MFIFFNIKNKIEYTSNEIVSYFYLKAIQCDLYNFEQIIIVIAKYSAKYPPKLL